MKTAFTMAEILLSLTIIGVVAAITLPSLTGNINERTWNTQRKALYARMSQAIALMPSMNNYGSLAEATSETSSVDTAAETFISSGLSKVLKINNICDNEHFEDCGITTSMTTLNGATISVPKTMKDLNPQIISYSYDTVRHHSQINTKAVAFETQNGESIIAYYSPTCRPNMDETEQHSSLEKMCVNFVYDLNGSKGPNTIGKDIGIITIFYPIDSIVISPMPANTDSNMQTQSVAMSACTKSDSDYRLPNRFELASIFINKLFINNLEYEYHYWSSSVADTTNGWAVGMSSGLYYLKPRTSSFRVRCIKR